MGKVVPRLAEKLDLLNGSIETAYGSVSELMSHVSKFEIFDIIYSPTVLTGVRDGEPLPVFFD